MSKKQWLVLLSEVDNPLTRVLAAANPVSSQSLLRYMRHVASNVGKKIDALMGEAFGLMFDGWSCGTLHFVAIYAVCVKDDVLNQPLLSISHAEHGQTADTHIEMIDSVIDVYHKVREMLCFIVGDNFSTNQANATRLLYRWLSAPVARFVVCHYLLEYEDLIAQVQTLSVQPRLLNNSAKLSRYTKLKALKANATRWPSTYKMLKRYTEIKKWNIMCLIRAPIAGLSTLVASKRSRTSANGSSSHCNLTQSLSTLKLPNPDEEEAVARFAVNDASHSFPMETVDFATATLRFAKMPRHASVSKNSSLLAKIPPTSNGCERLFSQCKLILSPTRSNLLPANFETIFFLRANRELWGFTSLMDIGDSEDNV
ncbi:hypothetical protein P3T76_010790 [Phytophthora citrophthora]|uniref:HAT C-terminal dimerisation domain-containing protein n=1 Tax=Phytophthora citrophthora TaxID=4793 RepID=A0AAD9GAZ6_9STRA|nr:hypothetical protein P3T76_010790 [Phytophthora citrophthora]